MRPVNLRPYKRRRVAFSLAWAYFHQMHRQPDFYIRFEKGQPVEINGAMVGPLEAIQQGNEVGGRHGIGIGLHAVENRFVGIKSREFTRLQPWNCWVVL